MPHPDTEAPPTETYEVAIFQRMVRVGEVDPEGAFVRQKVGFSRVGDELINPDSHIITCENPGNAVCMALLDSNGVAVKAGKIFLRDGQTFVRWIGGDDA